jgi:hypothetical protein
VKNQGPWRSYSPDYYRSDDDVALEQDDVRASLVAEIGSVGSIGCEPTSFGWYFIQDVFKWQGCFSPDIPLAGQYNYSQYRRAR